MSERIRERCDDIVEMMTRRSHEFGNCFSDSKMIANLLKINVELLANIEPDNPAVETYKTFLMLYLDEYRKVMPKKRSNNSIYNQD